MRTRDWLLAAVIAAVASDGKGGDRPTAESLLAEYQRSVEKLDRVRIEWSDAAKPAGGQDDYTLFKDRARWKIDRKFSDEPNTARQQWLIGDEALFVQQYYGPELEPRPVNMSWNRRQYGSKAYFATNHCLFIFGCLRGDGGYPIWAVMRESGSVELLAEPETLDGFLTYVLKSKGKYGEHKVWLDPASGSLPRRIEVRKHPGNLLDHEQLGSVPRPASGTQAKANRPGGLPPFREYSLGINQIQIEKKGGVFVTTCFENTVFEMLIDGRKREYKTEFKAKILDIDPTDFPANAFEFDIAVPNGTDVFAVGPGDERIADRYEWVDGKVRQRVGR